jgi:hypothetical protein
MSTRHRGEKKQYTYEEVVQKYKDDYEKTMATLKIKHDEYIREPSIKIIDFNDKVQSCENSITKFGEISFLKTDEERLALEEQLKKFCDEEIKSKTSEELSVLKEQLRKDNITKDLKEIKKNLALLEIIDELKRIPMDEKKDNKEDVPKINNAIKLKNSIITRFNSYFNSDVSDEISNIRQENRKISKKNKSIETKNLAIVNQIITYADELKELEKIKTNAEYTSMALMEAEKLWLAVKIVALSNENFIHMKDEEKIDLIRKDFAEFYNNFPIVSRYMVCMGQYSQKAFRKFLKQCEQKLNHSPVKREEDYMQNQWIECQASYVRYLWEESHIKKFSRKESNEIWQQAHRALTEEFKQFKDQHMKTEEKIKRDEKKHKVELFKEAVGRVSTGAQSLDLEKTRALVNKLRDKKYKQNYELALRQLEENTKFIGARSVSRGINQEALQEYEEELKQQEYKKKYKKMDLTPKMF